MPADVTVSPGRVADVDAVSALHRDQLSESFLSSLGERFLGVLYRRIVLSPTSTLLVAHRDETVVGFISGTDDTGALYREFVRRDAVRAGLAAAPRLLRHPWSTFETLRYGGGTPTADLPRAELLSLAVAPSARRTGIGSRLIADLNADLTARGVPAVRVTVAADNDVAVAAYQRAGYRAATEIEVHRGRTSSVLVWP